MNSTETANSIETVAGTVTQLLYHNGGFYDIYVETLQGNQVLEGIKIPSRNLTKIRNSCFNGNGVKIKIVLQKGGGATFLTGVWKLV